MDDEKKFALPPHVAPVLPFPEPTREIKPDAYYHSFMKSEMPPHPLLDEKARKIAKRNFERSMQVEAARQERLAGFAERAKQRADAIRAAEQAAKDRAEFGAEVGANNAIALASIAETKAKAARTLCRSLGIPVPAIVVLSPMPDPVARKRLKAEAMLRLIDCSVVEHIAREVEKQYGVVLTKALLRAADRHGYFADREDGEPFMAILNAMTIGLLDKIGGDPRVLSIAEGGMQAKAQWQFWDYDTGMSWERFNGRHWG
jgi:hypothetical protein